MTTVWLPLIDISVKKQPTHSPPSLVARTIRTQYLGSSPSKLGHRTRASDTVTRRQNSIGSRVLRHGYYDYSIAALKT